MFSWFGRGIRQDLKQRTPYYWSDWKDGFNYRVIPATVFIYFANILPAIAFAQDMFDRTKGAYGVNEVLLASAMGGVVFGILAGQPLCIVGVTGPVCIFNYTVFEIVEPKGIPYFPFMTWICIWAFVMHTIIAVLDGVKLMKYVTMFSCDIFACFINIVYIQKGIQILTRQFNYGEDHAAAYFSIITALCILLFGLTCTVLGDYSPFGKRWVRKFVSDYSLPALVVFFTGFTFFPGRISSLDIQRLPTGIAYQPSTHSFDRNYGWFIHFWDIEVGYVFLAIPFALLLTALFYFDHNISSIMCQGPQFDLKKPSSFHWDFFLLGVTTLVAGLLGLPPPNGLIPQAPLHTSSLVMHTPKHDNELDEGSSAGNGADPVVEQRVSNTLQGLLTLGTMCGPLLVVLGLVPQGVLAGLFWMMGVPGFLGCEVMRRVGLIVTDKPLRKSTEPLYGIGWKSFYGFVLLEVVGAVAEVGMTESIAAVGFPGVLLLFMLVGALLHRIFPSKDLEVLDSPAASDFIMSTLHPKLVTKEDEV